MIGMALWPIKKLHVHVHVHCTGTTLYNYSNFTALNISYLAFKVLLATSNDLTLVASSSLERSAENNLLLRSLRVPLTQFCS